MTRLAPLVCLALAACAAPRPAETGPGAPPELNAPYKSPDLDVAAFVSRFENESREVYARRNEILAALGLRPGMAVADVGAGTGLFTFPIAREVGPGGRVFAVEIAPNFRLHLRDKARELGLDQVEVVRATDTSTGLLPDSCDLVFVCDTYHHFEAPRATLASIHDALRPQGVLVVVDFERVPGVTREWILDHVRAGKEVVRSEIESAGFELEEEVDAGLSENYMLRFRRI